MTTKISAGEFDQEKMVALYGCTPYVSLCKLRSYLFMLGSRALPLNALHKALN